MAGGKYNKKERAKYRAAQAAQAAQQDATMEMDVEPVAESSAAAEQSPNITDPAQQGNTDNSEGEAMNMREVGEALDAAINDNDDDSLRALLQSADFDVLRLANMTFDRPDAVRAFAAVLSTAVMVAQDTAVDAEDMAAEAAERAANAETKAAEASDKAAAADSNCDGVFGRSVENAHVILGQGEHISALQRQMSALAAIPSVAPTSPVVS